MKAGFSIRFDSADFSGPLALDGVGWQVEQLRWRATGGPWDGRLRADCGGSLERLWGLVDRLRCPVQVLDARGPAWWGYASAVEINGPGGVMRVDLDSLANQVAVQYRDRSPDPWGGAAVSTAWASAADSMRRYGTRQWLATSGPAFAEEAQAQRDTLLKLHSWPEIVNRPERGREAGPAFARVELRGWWQTLDWRYYSDPRGKVGNPALGSSFNLGTSAVTARWAQRFTPGAEGWTANEVWLRLRKNGLPDDAVRLDLCQDGANLPGSSLAYGLASGPELPDERGWVSFTLNAPVRLSPGAAYWLQLTRTGAADANNAYVFSAGLNAPYPDGHLLYSANGWQACDPPADLSFVVQGVEDNGAILQRMLAQCGAFLTDTRLECFPGISSLPYREGSKRGRAEIEALLMASAAGERLLARIDPDRTARVYTRPAPETARYQLDTAGCLRHLDGRPALLSDQPAGEWANLAGLAAPGAYKRIFIEECTWDAASGLRV